MNKSELIDAIAESAELTKADAGRALDGFIKAVEGALKNEDTKEAFVALVGFGTFSVKERAERKGRNPQTGEEITIKAAKIPSFKAGKSLKDAVK
jgi:DNA-binding protein HU-beta